MILFLFWSCYFIDNMEWEVHDHSVNDPEACWLKLDDDAPIKASNVPTYSIKYILSNNNNTGRE